MKPLHHRSVDANRSGESQSEFANEQLRTNAPTPCQSGVDRAVETIRPTRGQRRSRNLARSVVFLTLVFCAIAGAASSTAANISADFNGSSYTRTTGNVDLANRSFTLMAWVRRGGFGASARWIFTQGTNGVNNSALRIGFASTNIFDFQFAGNNLRYTDASIADSNWHLWACTYDSLTRTRRIYRDGVLAAFDTATAHYQGTGSLTIGGEVFNNFTAPTTGTTTYFSGTIDEVKVYQRALSQEEIVASMRNETVSSANLIEYWPFDADNNTQFLSALPTGQSLNQFGNIRTATWADLQSENHVANFDGTNDRLQTSESRDYLASESFTVMAWARKMGGPSATGRVRYVFTHGSQVSTRNYLFFGLNASDQFGFGFSGDDLWASGQPVSDFTWHHWTGTYDSATHTQKLYRDGKIMASRVASAHFQGSGPIGIGTAVSRPTFNGNWVGQIDDVKVFQSALNPNQIQQEMSPRLVSGGSLLEHWDFEQEDSSGFPSALDDALASPLNKSGGIASMPDDPGQPLYQNIRISGNQTPNFHATSVRLDNQSFTLMAWARKTENNGQIRMIFTQGTTESSHGLLFGFSSDNRFTFDFWGTDTTTRESYTDTDWHHWVGTYDHKTRTRRIYRDGALVASGTAPSHYRGTGNLLIGHRRWKFVDQAAVADLRKTEERYADLLTNYKDDLRDLETRKTAVENELARLKTSDFQKILKVGLWSNSFKIETDYDAYNKKKKQLQSSIRGYEDAIEDLERAVQINRNRLDDVERQIEAASATWDSSPLWVWKGDLDELRVFNRALTAEEVRSEGVRFGLSALPNDLIGGWTLDGYSYNNGTYYFHPMVPGLPYLFRTTGDFGLPTEPPPLLPPSIGPLPSITINEDAPMQTLDISGIFDGAPGRLARMGVNVQVSDPALVRVLGRTYDGTGTTARSQFRLMPDANGIATVTVTAAKRFGDLTAEGTRSFELQVMAVNDTSVIGSSTSARLQGSNQSVEVPGVQGMAEGNNPHTVSAWIRPAGPLSEAQSLLRLGDPVPGALDWSLEPAGSPNQIAGQFRVQGNDSSLLSVPNISSSGWTHLATSWDGMQFKVFVNGVLAGQFTSEADTELFALQGIPLLLGGSTSGASGFNGNIDEVQVWNRPLTASEIQINMNHPLSGAEDGLLLYWRFDEGEDERATDSAAIAGNKAHLSQGTFLNGAGYERATTPDFGIVVGDEDKPNKIYLPGYDVDSPLSYTIVTPPSNGTLSRAEGNWSNPLHNPIIYTPNPNFTGSDSLIYRLNDGETDSPEQTIEIRITNLNDPPTVSSYKVQLIDEDEPPRSIPLLVDDPETSADSLRLSAMSSDQKVIPNQNIVFHGSGTNRTFTITPVSGELGRSTITLTVSDTDGASTVRLFDVQILRRTYAVVDLGTLPNHTVSSGMAINDNGLAVGYSGNGPGDRRAFVYLGVLSGGDLLDLGTLGGSASEALAINGSDQVVGVSLAGDGQPHGFLATSIISPITDLGILVGGTSSSAFGISSQGFIVGSANTLLGETHAVVRSLEATEFSDIGGLGGKKAQATAINDFGIIVGYSQLEDGQERAFVFQDGEMTDLGVAAPNHTGSRAWAISPTGQIVGESLVNRTSVAMAYQDGAMTELGLLNDTGSSVAYGVNGNGQVVGTAVVGQGTTRAFLYSAGELLDLNNLIPTDSGWELTEARGINSNGEIIGTGTINGERHAFVAIPATPIGRPLARPPGAVATRPPEVELLEANADDRPDNSFLWVDFEKRLYAIRPVTARVNWPTSIRITDTNRIQSISINVWPRTPQSYVVSSPVELEPRGVPIAHSFQSVLFSTTGGVSVDVSTRTFRASRTGWSVLYYLKTDGEDSDPRSQHPYFEVVKRVTWDDPAYLLDGKPWTIGEVLNHETHSDYLGKQGFVILQGAPYDGAGEARAHDRNTRLGPIIPVNLDTSSENDDLVVAWYQTNQIGVAWSTDPVRYSLSWPTNAPPIVIASGLGSGPLPDEEYPNRMVYGQPDPTLPGYNPNEEHGLILPGSSGDDALFSLRSDLNDIVGVSEPFSLLKYGDPVTGDWRIKVFRVVAEEAPYFFNYDGVAGNEIAPPFPLSVLPLCEASLGVSGPYWENVRGKLYAKAAGPFGGTANIVTRYYYPLQPGFFYDLNKDGSPDAPESDCIPWLNRLPGRQVGPPVNISYTIRWPDDPPVLQVGETLLNPKRGLPGVRSMAKASIVYDSVTDTIDRSKYSARLYDPLSDRKIKLIGKESIPLEIQRANIDGKEVFTDLAFPIRVRLKYDPGNRELLFGGYLDESGIGSNPLLLPNILTSQERKSLLNLAPKHETWPGIVDRLYITTRNPNGLDVDGDDHPDNSVLAGQLLSGSTLVQESFGSLPKALTAGDSDVPPEQPRPGAAISFAGSGQMDRCYRRHQRNHDRAGFWLSHWQV
ncbi:MAG: DUF3466 family protein, partial [Verrucomicrobia bacterium]|nr:DUF3466 family protein [Verrucomicrobiota bacterium]